MTKNEITTDFVADFVAHVHAIAMELNSLIFRFQTTLFYK